MQYSLEDIKTAAQFIFEAAGEQKIWCFVGEMGAGKTTLIKAICHELEVEDDLSSPSFAIVNEYQTKQEEPVYHFDFYRIEDDLEIIQLGVEDYFFSESLCLIEWPDKVIDYLPDHYLKINVKLVSDSLREIIVTHV